MQQWVDSRWFALAEFLLAAAAGFLIFLLPQYGGWLLVILLLPWLFRLLANRVNFAKPAFLIPGVLIISTALVGVWGSYDRQAAVEKLWIILASLAVFLVLVNQPRANLGIIGGLVGLMGVFIAIFYLLTNDWQVQSSDFELISRAGEWITSVRPQIDRSGIPPNFSGGLLALAAPIPLALAFHPWKRSRNLLRVIFLGMALVILLALFLTSSRGAWLALVGGAGLWLLWQTSVYLSQKAGKSPFLLFGIVLLVGLLLFSWLLALFPGGIVGFSERLPGLPTGASRLELASQTVKLIGDYPYTGGGLHSFAGQFSQYIMVTPFFLFDYSHNFYLDVLFEQGLVGGVSILVIMVGALASLLAAAASKPGSKLFFPLTAALVTSSFVILLHGLIDDPLYGGLGTPLLFLIPGFALLLARETNTGFDRAKDAGAASSQKEYNPRNPGKWIITISGLAVIVIAAAAFWKPVLASWNANLGAVQMAKWELAGWPRDQWNPDPDTSPLDGSQQRFNAAVKLGQNQRTAWHRSGLIDLQAREFNSAQLELEKAYQIDPDHRGIKKNLGYVYAWNGDYVQAGRMLSGIDEAGQEMGVYAWWWTEQDRPDLAIHAGEMVNLLER